jgi:hypothetical protein
MLALWTRLSSISIQNIGGGVTRRVTSGNQEEGSNRGSDVNSDNARFPWERFGNVISIKSLHSHMRANILKLRQPVRPCNYIIKKHLDTGWQIRGDEFVYVSFPRFIYGHQCYRHFSFPCYTSHHIFLDFITLIISSEEYKLWSSILCIFQFLSVPIFFWFIHFPQQFVLKTPSLTAALSNWRPDGPHWARDHM